MRWVKVALVGAVKVRRGASHGELQARRQWRQTRRLRARASGEATAVLRGVCVTESRAWKLQEVHGSSRGRRTTGADEPPMAQLGRWRGCARQGMGVAEES